MIIHKIKVHKERKNFKNTSSKRVTTTVRYVACLVATATADSVRISAESLEKAKRDIVELKREIKRLTKKWGISPEAAEREHDQRLALWEGSDCFSQTRCTHKSFYAVQREIRKKLNPSGNPRKTVIIQDRVAAMAKEVMGSLGFIDPWDINTSYGLVEAQRDLIEIERQVAYWSQVVEGSQMVLSWHTRVDLAYKARSTGICALEWRAKGDRVDVRTDIEVIEKE